MPLSYYFDEFFPIERLVLFKVDRKYGFDDV